MHTNFIQYTIIIFAILSLNTCTYDKSNFKKLNQPVVIKKPIEEKEINYINELKARVEKLKEKNNGKIVRDAYNVFVNDDNRNDSPTKGGFIHVSFNSEPYILLTWLDNSAVTAYITDYIYDTLLYQDKETFELRPSLANSYEEYDIIWLKGKRSDNIFKEKGDNNFIIGTIDESKIKWDSTKKKILEITIKTKSGIKVINGNQLRYKHDIENPDDSNDDYIRAYDKQVVISFSLKENVKWHDGKPFTADDVLFSMDVIKNPYIIRLAHLRNNYQSLKTWVKEGNNKITFYFDKQYFKTLEYASGFTILPKHIYLPKGSTITKKEFADYFTKHEANIVKNGFGPVGTGPYYFPSKYTQKKLIDTGWVKNDRILLLRNDNYFDKKRSGNLKKLFFHFIPEHEISFLQIKKGEIDFDPSLQYTQYFNSSSTKEFKSRYVKGIYYIGAFGYIGYNMKKIYFTDRRVRTAITMLLDRERLLRTVYYNLGIIVTGSQNYFGTAYNRSVKHYPYNRQLAFDLLNKAGWIDTDGDGLRDKDGIPFVIDLLHPGKNPPIVGAF
ncbi:MAG: ABC transporter substrate-binding protein, partial [Spirochaetota bacterium]|nr:ABC transporter substrate-binding protein [Spirochaetota bacterium]